MNERNILFVLGAGASRDYGFPLGVGLKEDVIHNLKHSQDQGSQIAGDRLGRLNPDSLDDFSRLIDHDPASVAAMKKSIARRILAYEEACRRSSSQIRQQTDDWIRKIGEGLWGTHNNFHLNVITFNYDRLLEWRLNEWLCGKLLCAEGDAWEVLYSKVTIHHVYGRLPPLAEKEAEVLGVNRNLFCSFGNMRDDSNSYGSEFINPVINSAQNYLKTIYESPRNDGDPDSVAEQAKFYQELFKKCGDVHIFGFGFNEQNLKILGFPYKKPEFATRRRPNFGEVGISRISPYSETLPNINCILHPSSASDTKRRIEDFRLRQDCGSKYDYKEGSILNYLNAEKIFGS